MTVLDASSMLRMLTDYADCINREDPNETKQLFDELTTNVREFFPHPVIPGWWGLDFNNQLTAQMTNW